MKRLLILFSVSVIALAALVIPEVAFPTVTEAQSPIKIDKPVAKLRTSGWFGVNWAPVPGATGSTRYGIRIQKEDEHGNITEIFNAVGRSASSYGRINAAKYGILPGSRYRASVNAINPPGEWSDWSDWVDLRVSALVPAKASKPIFNLRASGWLGVNWHDIQGAVGHEFDLKERAGGTTGAGISTWERYVPWRASYIFLGRSLVKDGMDYRIRVRAQNKWGHKGAWSDWSDWSGSIVRGAK